MNRRTLLASFLALPWISRFWKPKPKPLEWIPAPEGTHTWTHEITGTNRMYFTAGFGPNDEITWIPIEIAEGPVLPDEPDYELDRR